MGAGDRIILGPGISEPNPAYGHEGPCFLESDVVPEIEALELAREWRQTVEDFFGADDVPDTSPDVFRRYVLPAASIFRTMRQIADENARDGVSTRFIVCGPPPVKRIRTVGSWSPELPRGDRNVAAAGLMAILREATDFTVELRPSRSLLIRAKFLAWYPALWALNAVAALRLAFRLALVAAVRSRWQDQDSGDDPGTVLVIARTASQTRVARRVCELLMEEGVKTQVAFLPPAFRGSVRTDLKCAQELRDLRWSVPSVRHVIGSIFLNRRGTQESLPKFFEGDKHLPTTATLRRWAPHVYLERRAVSAHEYCFEWLCESVAASRGVVSFEVRGREAMLLRRAVSSSQVRHVGIQIVVKSGQADPWFPSCDVFFCTSPQVRDYLKNYSLRPERLEFAGLVGVALDRSSLGGQDARPRVLFATQPSSSHVMTEIFSLLQRVKLSGDICLRVRLHPRDSLRYYPKEVRSALRNHLSDNSLDEDLARTDVVVAMSSSVATEALARGMPILLCDFGNGPLNRARYRERAPVPGSLHVALDVNSVSQYFQRAWAEIVQEAHLVRTHLFGDLQGSLGARMASEFGQVRDA